MALAVLGGAAIGVCTGVRAGDAAAVAIAATSLAVVVSARAARAALVYVTLAAAMTAWGAAARDRAAAPPLLVWYDEAARATGRQDGPWFVDGVLASDAVPMAGGVALSIDVLSVERSGHRQVWAEPAGRLQAFVSGSLAAGHIGEWTRGRNVRAPVALRRPNTHLNFGGPSPARQLLRRAFVLTGTIKSAALVEIERGAPAAEAAAGLRQRVRAAAARFIAPHAPEAAAIVTAILIGDRAGLSDEVERRLQEAGTYHVIAISGGNVALLAAMCFGILRLLIRSPRLVAAATLAAVVTYGWIVGGDASVVRAVTAAALYLVLGTGGVRPRPGALLRVVALLLVVVDPLTVIDIGAWLSFAATFGIVTYGPAAARWIADHLPGSGGTWVAIRWFSLLVVATLAAEVVLLPVAASAFSRVSLAGVLLNVVAIPAMAAVQLAGIGVVCLGSLWPQLASVCAAVAAGAASLLLNSCSLIDVLPWLSWRVPPTAPGWTAAYYLAVVLATRAQQRCRRIATMGAAAMLLVVIVWAPTLESSQPTHNRLRLALVDVGQGDAVVVQTSDGQSLLVDAGGTPGPFDIGGRVVTPALWALGVRRLDWLALSHGDRDHTGGVPAVIRDMSPAEIWEGVPVPPDPERNRLRTLTAARRIAWRTLQAGDRIELKNVVIDALHPPLPEWERQKVRNDDSVVLRVRYGLVEFWLTGDAGGEFERSIEPLVRRSIEESPRLRILKVGHHGSRTATSAAFVEALSPQIALISAGRGNLFGHPSREVLDRLAHAGAAVFRTDEEGATVVETDGVSARVTTASGRSWSVAFAGVVRGLAP